MAQVLIRGLDQNTVERLKQRALRNNRSLQMELREILERAAQADMATAREISERLRKQLAGRRHSDSADLVAEDRSR